MFIRPCIQQSSGGVSPPPVTANLTVWANLESPELIQDTGTPISLVDGTFFNRLQLQSASSLGATNRYLRTYNIGGADAQAYRTSVNGYPCVELPPSHKMFLVDPTAVADFNGVSSDQCTLFIVAAYTEANNWTSLLSTRGSTADRQYCLAYDTRTQKRAAFGVGNSSGSLFYADMLARDTAVGIRVLAAQCEGAGSNIVAWKDGVKQGTGALSGTHVFYNAADSQVVVRDGPSVVSGTAYIYEVLVYDALLSDTDTGLVNDWLTAKFGM